MKDMKEGIIMKEIYERPRIMVEEFAVNRAIAACGDEVGRDITFDCMIGSQTDTTNVLTDNCGKKAGTTNLKTAIATNSTGHSNYSGGTWSTSSGGGFGGGFGGGGGQNLTTTYTAPSDAIGLLYYCSSGGTSCFTTNTGVLSHTTNHSGTYHVQIAPLYGTSIEDVIVGS